MGSQNVSNENRALYSIRKTKRLPHLILAVPLFVGRVRIIALFQKRERYYTGFKPPRQH